MALQADQIVNEQASADLDKVVADVLWDSNAKRSDIRPEELGFLRSHALKKQLKFLDIWALGVGSVITGEYFGWNLALKNNTPVAVLLATLFVCFLYLIWVLALSELSVAMPFAGGPQGFGRRAFGPLVGFIMGWSMFLECQFATIATALATGGYVAFLFNPDAPSHVVQLIAGLGTVLVFLALHVMGVRLQSKVMIFMTYGAIGGLFLFWGLAATNFSWDRIWTKPLLPADLGWISVLNAIPYCLWWLVIIETVSVASEETQDTTRSIPRGLVWGQLTLIGLIGPTWFFACGAVQNAQSIVTDANGEDISYPLSKVIRDIPIGQNLLLVYGFGIIAIFGMIASYHGMVYGTSRQLFALGRAGYLPTFLGKVHPKTGTPNIALIVCSIITALFLIGNLWFQEEINVAVLISTFTALIWYIMAMVCLIVLRSRQPGLFARYRAPFGILLPIMVVLLSALAVWVYSAIDVKILPITAAFYIAGVAYYLVWAKPRLQTAAPEELSSRLVER